MRFAPATALAVLTLALTACEKEPAPPPTPEPTVSVPRTLVGADLDLTTLGARITGPQGSEFQTLLSVEDREIGRLVSSVACPREVTECLPRTLPEGTVYTYIHRVTLAEADDATAPAPATPAATAAPETGATLFRTTLPAAGFAHSIGYDRKQAEAALGVPDAISITSDGGQLIWRVTAGQGWKPGTTITFWWQSTVPPEGLHEAYLISVNGQEDAANGPFPPEDKPVEGKRAN